MRRSAFLRDDYVPSRSTATPSLQLDLVRPLESLYSNSRQAVDRRIPTHRAPRLLRRAPNVRQQHDPRLRQKRVVRFDVGLARRDVKTCSCEFFASNGFDEGGRVDDGTSCSVYDVGRRLHLAEEVGVDDVLGLGREGAAEDEEIALGGEVGVGLGGREGDAVEVGGGADVEEVFLVGEGLADLRGGVESARDTETEETLERNASSVPRRGEGTKGSP